jgi:hypothetical protein
MLSLRWPAFIRWLYWSQSNIGHKSNLGYANSVKERLIILEKLGGECNNIVEWKDALAKQMDLVGTSISWLDDKNLMNFFKRESEITEAKTRISFSAGNGVY